VGKWFRDARIFDICEGIGEIQRLIIARDLLGSTPKELLTGAWHVTAKAACPSVSSPTDCHAAPPRVRSVIRRHFARAA
jgi:hypothetical protein